MIQLSMGPMPGVGHGMAFLDWGQDQVDKDKEADKWEYSLFNVSFTQQTVTLYI